LPVEIGKIKFVQNKEKFTKKCGRSVQLPAGKLEKKIPDFRKSRKPTNRPTTSEEKRRAEPEDVRWRAIVSSLDHHSSVKDVVQIKSDLFSASDTNHRRKMEKNSSK
jgi:hypothetical protein